MEEQVKKMNEWGQVVQLLLLKDKPDVCAVSKEFISGAVKAFWGIKHLLIPCAESCLSHPGSSVQTWEHKRSPIASAQLPISHVARPHLSHLRLFRRYEKVPVILVGNKVDLESEREVSSSEGQALAEEWGCPFMETSAKSKTMVDELFAEIVRQMDYAAQPDKDDPCCSSCNIQ